MPELACEKRIINDQYLSELKSSMTEIPWYYHSRVADESQGREKIVFPDGRVTHTSSKQIGFSHGLLLPAGKSEWFDLFQPLIGELSNLFDLNETRIFRARLGMYTACPTESIHQPHIDMKEPNKVILFYFNSSEAATFLYREKYVANERLFKFHVEEMIAPTENSAIMFDGLKFHSSSSPLTNEMRVVMSLNYI